MRILLIDNSLDNTGASKALIKTVGEIKLPNIEFIFLFPKGSKCVAIVRQAGFKAYELRFREISRRAGDIAFYFPSLIINTFKAKKIVKKEKIDIVHVNDIYNMLGLSLKLVARRKLITHVRRMPESFPSKIYKMWSRLHVKFANKIIAVSEANKNALPVNDKTVVIYDPLPENETRCRYEPRECLDKRLAILYLANYTKGKGHIYALKILKEAIHKFPGWSFSLDFYGGNFGLDKNDRYRKSLEVFVKENDLESNVKFHDETKAIEEVMKAHDLVLNLSDSESFSRVTLEALFYGIPIVATDVGGTREMVLDGQTGVLVQPKNVSAMSGGFEKLITNDTLRNFLASNAYNLVRERFSNRNTVEKMEETYKNVGN